MKTKLFLLMVIIFSVITNLFAEMGFHLLTTISGENPGDQFCTVKNVGDVNGDGYNDLLVGAAESSYAKLYLGGADFDTIADLDLRIPNDLEYFGQTLACGDLNGDGYSDFAIGAPFYDFNYRCGKIFVYFGGADVDSIPDIEIEGYGYWAGMGNHIVSDCDVNGDGYDDLLTCSGLEFRKTYIYYGGVNMDNVPDVCLAGDDSVISRIQAPAGLGDVDSDGYDDFMVTAIRPLEPPYEDLKRIGNYLVYGGDTISLDHSVLFADDSTFGDEINRSGIGDLNADGYADFYIGYSEYIIFYSGLKLSSMYQVERINGEGHFISFTNESFNINDDNYNDFIYTYYSTETDFYGNLVLFCENSLLGSISDYEISQGPNGIGFGKSCSFLGDINNDGKPDIAVGSQGGAGKVYIYSFGEFTDNIELNQPENPEQFSFVKAYPNPFNSSATIEYNLPLQASVMITICDLCGKEVARLDDGIRPKGATRVHFEGDRLSSGIYFCRLGINHSYNETIKILLLK